MIAPVLGQGLRRELRQRDEAVQTNLLRNPDVSTDDLIEYLRDQGVQVPPNATKDVLLKVAWAKTWLKDGWSRAPAQVFSASSSPVTCIPPLTGQSWLGMRPNEALWVRNKHYAALANVVKTGYELMMRYTGVVVTGNWGIGKSMGAINSVAAMRLAEDRALTIVVILSCSVHVHVDGYWYTRRYDRVDDIHDVLEIPMAVLSTRDEDGTPGKLLVLHDTMSPGPTLCFQSRVLTQLQRHFRVLCVLFASPERKHYSGFMKDFASRMFVLPTWSLEELRVVFEASLGSTLLEERYRDYGGIVRHFDNDYGVSFDRDERARTVQRRDLRRCFDDRYTFFEEDAASLLFQLVPSSNYKQWCVTFRSDTTRDMWFDARLSQSVDDARKLLRDAIQSQVTHHDVQRQCATLVLALLREGSERSVTLQFLRTAEQPSRTLTDLLRVEGTKPKPAGRNTLTAEGVALLTLPPVSVPTSIFVDAVCITDTPGLYVSTIHCGDAFIDFALVTEHREVWMFQVVAAAPANSPRRMVPTTGERRLSRFMSHFKRLQLQPRMVWVGCDGQDGVASLQSCQGAHAMDDLAHFSWQVPCETTQVI